MIKNIYQHRFLLEQTVIREFKVRYKQTFLGISWVVLQPLIMSIIFFFIMKVFRGHYHSKSIHFIATYFCMSLWTFVASSIQFSVNSITGHPRLVTQVKFPREIFPLSLVLISCLDCLISTSFGFIYILIFLPEYFFSCLWIYLALVLLFPIVLAVALFLSSLNVIYRDLKYITPIFLQVMFFLTPVFYPLHTLDSNVQSILALNPFGCFITWFKHIAFDLEPHPQLLLVHIVTSLVILKLSCVIFNRIDKKMADVI